MKIRVAKHGRLYHINQIKSSYCAYIECDKVELRPVIKSILILTMLLLGSLTASHAQTPQLANQYWNQAEAAEKNGRYLEAAKLYEKSAEAEKNSHSPRLAALSVQLGMAGFAYSKAGQYDMALKCFDESLVINRKLGREDKIAELLYNIGVVYVSSDQYDKALKYFEKSLLINRKLGREDGVATNLNNIGGIYKTWLQNEKALKYFEEAVTIDRKLRREEGLSINLSFIGTIYDTWGQYDKALKNYEEALAIFRKLGREDKIAKRLNSIGLIYKSLDQYDKALKYYEEALTIARKLGNEDGVASLLRNIGILYYTWGQYDKALKNYEEALAIYRKLGNEDGIATSLRNIGMIYDSWGQYDKALKNYEEALAIFRKLERVIEISRGLNDIGMVYNSLRQHDKALNYFEEALTIARKLGNEDGVASLLSNIGGVYQARWQYNKALKNFDEALAIFRKLEAAAKVATLLNNIGTVYSSWEQYDKALKYYEEALAIDRELEAKASIATSLSNVGMMYYGLKRYNKAIENFRGSVDLLEKLRKTATGTSRRDYLASQIKTYRGLISAYLRDNDLPNAFKTMELSRAKLLAERLAGDGALPPLPSVESIQQEMSTDTVIIAFAISDRDDGFNPISLLITKENITSAELDKKKFMESLQVDYKQAITQLLANQRGLKVVKKSNDLDKKTQDRAATTFDDVINYYRSLLTNPSSGINRSGRGLVVKAKPGATAAGENLDRMLYDLLIKPVAKHIKDKKRIIIIPDGVLSYLPFETLTDENNAYLVNRCSISYAQSMSVMDMLKKRNYPTGRKPMLAFGGAIYDEMSYTADMITNEKQLLALAKDVNDTTRGKRAMGNAYASLGFAKWDNLPGTLSEVKAIAGTVKGAKIVTGRDVTESSVKRLSKSGELAKYKVIHYATHGIVVPELPELSAIVLSQVKNQPDGEDGYLRMDKIEQLKLKADFVNLSACETGLGKIFGGEGVVGLTHSFLLAGANGLSVSLWSVNDASTSKFMVALYNLVEQKKIGYGDAITEIKRDFIQGKFGEAYKSPYYWAPFVYYGR